MHRFSGFTVMGWMLLVAIVGARGMASGTDQSATFSELAAEEQTAISP